MGTEIATKKDASLEIPEWAKDNDGATDFSTSDIKLSQIYLTQQMSEAAADGTARPGDFTDSVTKENFGKEVNIIILKKYVEWMTFRPKAQEAVDRDAENGVIWADGETMKRSRDGKSWADGVAIDKEIAWKYEQYKYYVLIQGVNSLPSILSFKNTSKKAGKELANLLFRFTNVNKEPIYARSYKLSSNSTKNDKGTFFEMKALPNQGFISEEEAMVAKDFRNFIEANSHSIVEDIVE